MTPLGQRTEESFFGETSISALKTITPTWNIASRDRQLGTKALQGFALEGKMKHAELHCLAKVPLGPAV